MRDSIKFVLIIICVIAAFSGIIYGTVKMDESVTRHSTVKLAKVTTWRDPISGFEKTSLISYDGSCMVFWGDLSDTFQAEEIYELTYRAEYRLLFLDRANKLLDHSEQLEEFE